MPIIPYPSPAAETANIWKLMLHSPQVCAGAQGLGKAIMMEGVLPANIRELAILATFRLEGGNYGYVQHVPIALKAGCSEKQIAAIEAVRFDDAAFSAPEKAVLALAREVAQKVRASEAVVEEAKKHFSPAEIVEIVMATAYYGMNTRFAETMRLEPDTAFVDKMTKFERVT